MLRLPQTLLHDTATATLAGMLDAVRAEPSASVAVDASALQRFDSTALAVLLELRRAALQTGKTLVLQGVPQRLHDLADLYGIAELLPSQA
ncbi:STAS domain-containing protein [Rhodoferax sp.]|uniref:STAS domain-containing protein n=1 Tax=Rhodoferax sp. TaxID=50421 RepID=UPI002637CFBE|nr:STAS domain-containing protein [Rhodoferax sp.]MDD2919255.1 STAS domain-containing protein [Rhodoferax sp.]